MKKLFNKIKSFFIKPKKEENLSIEEIIKKHVYEDNNGVKEKFFKDLGEYFI